jgi:hypothetical protein
MRRYISQLDCNALVPQQARDLEAHFTLSYASDAGDDQSLLLGCA